MTVSGTANGGVSADGNTADLAAVINGGDEFVKRMNDMKEARERLEKANADLALGKSAVDAHNEAQRVLGEAKAKRDADMAMLAQELDTARTTINVWHDSVKTQAKEAMDQANTHLAHAQSKHEAAQAIRAEADAYAASVREAAQQILTDANHQAAVTSGEAKRKSDAMMQDAARAKADAEKSLQAANNMKEKYTELVNKIQGVIGGS